ncbi:hypothetical protein, partial [Pseudomonas aeruginosa]|uniref:hypothetical protein n=1 Tax=Pseudomonas aeruginosa TaxID=287 RepID=UPI003977FC83
RLVFLTPKARPVIDRISDLATQSSELALTRVAPEKRDQLIDLLIEVRSALLEAAPEAGRQERRRGAANAAHGHVLA